MGSESILNIVATECRPEDEKKFNKWYNEVHIPLLFKYKGIKKVRRYQKIGGTEEITKYLAFYEFESKEDLDALHKSPEFATAIEEMQDTWKGGGFDIKWAAQYEPIKTWER